mgnify:CR=1 FL=1
MSGWWIWACQCASPRGCRLADKEGLWQWWLGAGRWALVLGRRTEDGGGLCSQQERRGVESCSKRQGREHGARNYESNAPPNSFLTQLTGRAHCPIYLWTAI